MHLLDFFYCVFVRKIQYKGNSVVNCTFSVPTNLTLVTVDPLWKQVKRV